MTTALDRARQTVARATQNYVRSGMSYCQQFAGNFWETHFGRPTPNSYPSARAAQLASGALNGTPETAPPGAFHYFEYGTLGHVGVALGSGLMASGTGRTAGALMDLGRNVLVHRVATYGLRYLGWSHTNGARPRIEGLTDHQAPVLALNQRQVKANADARRRSAPSTTTGAYDPNANLKAGSILTPSGFVRSTLPGGQPNGSDVWLVVGDTYVHVSGVTDAGLHDLADLGVIPKPVPKHPVTVVFGPTEQKVVEVVEGHPVPRPGDPQRDAFTFEGWAVGGSGYDFASPVTGPLTIEAVWAEVPDPAPNPGEGQEPTPEPDVPPVPTSASPLAALITTIIVGVGALLAGLGAIFGWFG